MTTRLIVAAMATLLCLPSALSMPKEKVPAGYTVSQTPNGECSTLRPAGWVEKTGIMDDDEMLWITETVFTKKTSSFVGFEVSVFPKPHSYEKGSASERAEQFISAEKSAWKEIQSFAPRKDSQYLHLQTIVFNDITGFVNYSGALADDSRNRLILVRFETPQPRWDELWKKHGKLMVNALKCKAPSK